MRPFDPQRHAPVLRPLLGALLPLLRASAAGADPRPIDTDALRPLLRRFPKDDRGFFSRAELIAGLAAFGVELGASDAGQLCAQLRMRPVRTESGVTPITVLTKPFPCPGQCVFCPNDVRMPKSYLSREPGCQRAEQNRFDPYLQTYNRLAALAAIGHSVEKAELIILGGTFSFYPEPYQRWFVRRCFDALNDMGQGVDRRASAGGAALDHTPLALAPRADEKNDRYNRALTPFLRRSHGVSLLHESEDASWLELEAAQRENEAARCRNVGLVIETRPDLVTEGEVLRLRRLGCTKVQLGVQSLNDATLSANRRGHDVASVRRAMHLLRSAGFKLLAHFMPNLLGSTPELDVEGAQAMFDDPAFRPDELKVYPCSLVESADLMRFYERGEYRPYAHDELLDVLARVLEVAPRYCRLSRVIRDISSCDIVAGNRMANLRELAEARLRAEGRACRDVRSREIRGEAIALDELSLRATAYESSIGREQFLELCTPHDRIAALLRLSLPRERSFVEELAGHAVIRELHVYGAALALGARQGGRPQHNGLGRSLVDEAARRARAEGYATLSVISAVGTRAYYRRLGFRDGTLYQHLDLG
jgi:elongator complex protein 3